MADIKFENQVSNNEGGVLAMLWRKILKERNFISILPVLIDRYIREQDLKEEKLGVNIKKKNRSTLITNIMATEMTFKVFYDLLKNLIKVKKIVIHVEITTMNDVTSIHSLPVVGNSINTEDVEIIKSGTNVINDISQIIKKEKTDDT